jgi:hypothetical protein
MTTPKPASAPPADAFERAMKASWEMVNPRDTSAPGSYYAGLNSGMIAALQTVRDNYKRELAASAQVREVEALPDAAKYLATLQPIPGVASRDWQRGWDACCAYVKRKPASEPVPVVYDVERNQRLRQEGDARCKAAEPVPVAQGDEWIAEMLDWLDEHGNDPELNQSAYRAIAQTIRQQQATIADHARIVAELEELCRFRIQTMNEQRDRAEQAEASLAACRALASKWRAEDVHDGQRTSFRSATACADELDAAMAPAPKQAP